MQVTIEVDRDDVNDVLVMLNATVRNVADRLKGGECAHMRELLQRRARFCAAAAEALTKARIP